ncbi:MAG: DUF2975 domain-containing protein [Sphingomonadaceae bacterium]|jgi:hypothetical protein
MSQIADNRILRITKLVVYLIKGFSALLVALGVVACAIAPFMFMWPESGTSIANDHLGTYPVPGLWDFMGIMFLGTAFFFLIWVIMRKLLAIINSVEGASPLTHANSNRLKDIGWLMVGMQIVGVPLEIWGSKFASFFGVSDVSYGDFELPIDSILVILLVFILAGIFEHGADMREELEGTV